jgi:NAD(P)-dependent dehydrogenase (short-subunit alcohol dehydrogenase family)
MPLQSAYCATKFALRGFTDSLRTELLREGSRVHLTMVQLPGLNTPQFGWSKLREPADPAVVRHPRLDSRRAEDALMTTIACAGD